MPKVRRTIDSEKLARRANIRSTRLPEICCYGRKPPGLSLEPRKPWNAQGPGRDGDGRAQPASSHRAGRRTSLLQFAAHPSQPGEGSGICWRSTWESGEQRSDRHTWFSSCYSWCRPQQMCPRRSGLMHNSRRELLPDG